MWAPYHAATRAKWPNAKTITDHFHVLQGLNDALAGVQHALQRHTDEATRSRLTDVFLLHLRLDSTIYRRAKQKSRKT